MKVLYWNTCGEGKLDIVLLHGWGLNSDIWNCIVNRLTPYFRLHLVDLPGYGRSNGYVSMSLREMANVILNQAPEKALWLGWSMGGLVASQIALNQPKRVIGLITVSSSPCFIKQGDWPGISEEILNVFKHQLHYDFTRTIERFLSLQTFGITSARKETKFLKSLIKYQQSSEVLMRGLEIVQKSDLRSELAHCSVPFLRIYGNRDELVPSRISIILDSAWPKTKSVIMNNAAHIPFMSHPDEFLELIIHFSQRYDLLYNVRL